MNDIEYLKLAINKAKESVLKGGFPAGAIIVMNGKIISEGISIGYNLYDPTSHSELSSIRKACYSYKTTKLDGAILYTSMQPCIMCFSSANWSGISKIVYGCKKSEDMISRGYYEGYNDIFELNNKNNKKIELVYIGDYEDEVLKIINDWEKIN